jgi:hypothetical protein
MKKIVSYYSFDALSSPKKVTFLGFSESEPLNLERILLVTNVTKSIILYNFASLGGSVSNNVLTLSASLNSISMDSSDKLQIFYDYPETSLQDTQPVSVTTLPLPANAATSILQTTANTLLTNINTKLPSGLSVSNSRLQVNTTSTIKVVSTSTITPTSTTSYSPNDVYGNVFQLQNIGAAGEGFYLLSLDVVFNYTSLPTNFGNFVIYLFSASPSSSIADNAAYNFTSIDREALMTLNGYPLFPSMARGGGSIVAESLGINHGYSLASDKTSIWGYLVTLGTPPANTGGYTVRARVTPA